MVRVHFYEVPRILKIIETECSMVVSRDGGRRKGGLVFNGHRLSVLEDEKLWRWMVGRVKQQHEYT